jgi:glutamine synthetase
VGPEPEFFIFSSIRYSSEANASFFEIDSDEAHWNSGRDEMPNLGHKIRPKGGYFPLPPNDQYQNMRTEMMLTLEDLGIAMECQHHEVGAPGQSEIDLRFDSLLNMGDSLAWFKYVLKNVATKYDHTVTFMPKPVYGDNGSGMHIHMSFWKDGTPLLFFYRVIESIYGRHLFVFFLIAYFFSDCIKKIYPGHGQREQAARMGAAYFGMPGCWGENSQKRVRPDGVSHRA